MPPGYFEFSYSIANSRQKNVRIFSYPSCCCAHGQTSDSNAWRMHLFRLNNARIRTIISIYLSFELIHAILSIFSLMSFSPISVTCDSNFCFASFCFGHFFFSRRKASRFRTWRMKIKHENYVDARSNGHRKRSNSF